MSYCSQPATPASSAVRQRTDGGEWPQASTPPSPVHHQPDHPDGSWPCANGLFSITMSSTCRTLLLTLSCIFAFMLSSCDKHRVYEANVDFPNKQWAVDSVPAFEFEVTDPSKPYNIYWNVRNTVAYPYRNLYLTYYIEDTAGHQITTDLHNMLLFEPKTGEPYGSGLGDIFSHQFMALPNFKFEKAGMYRIRLEQYMRTDTLPEIVSVGTRVEDAEAGS